VFLVCTVIPLLFGLWAQFKVKSTFKRYSQVAVASGMTGAQAAEAVLRNSDVTGVGIRPVAGQLSDPTTWGIFWPLCIAIIVLAIPFWWHSEWRYLAALVVPNLILTGGAYVTHYRAGISGSVAATAPRLYLHLAPAVAALAAVAAMTAWNGLRAARLEGVEVQGPGHDQAAGGRDHG